MNQNQPSEVEYLEDAPEFYHIELKNLRSNDVK